MTISKTNKIKLELLAPARDFESGRLAILAGADAVYIGGPNFGARSAASNSWESITALIELAHKYYVKVYLAINTIFFNEEAAEVKEAIWHAYEIGIDALIIQDMGILELELPPLPVKLVRARGLGGGKVDAKQSDAGLEISVAASDRQQVDTIVALEFDGDVMKLPAQ